MKKRNTPKINQLSFLSKGTLQVIKSMSIENFNGSEDDIQKLLDYFSEPTDLQHVVTQLYDFIKKDEYESPLNDQLPSLFIEKLDFNDVRKYRYLIQVKFFEGSLWVKHAYDALETERPGNKRMLLRYINSEYLKVMGEICANFAGNLSKIEIIRQYSDEIITRMINLLMKQVKYESLDISYESALDSITLLIIDAIVNCKVLENPNLLNQSR